MLCASISKTLKVKYRSSKVARTLSCRKSNRALSEGAKRNKCNVERVLSTIMNSLINWLVYSMPKKCESTFLSTLVVDLVEFPLWNC